MTNMDTVLSNISANSLIIQPFTSNEFRSSDWVCFPGLSFPVQLNSNGNAQCVTQNGATCLNSIGSSCSAPNLPLLICTDDRGTNSNLSWCPMARAMLISYGSPGEFRNSTTQAVVTRFSMADINTGQVSFQPTLNAYTWDNYTNPQNVSSVFLSFGYSNNGYHRIVTANCPITIFRVDDPPYFNPASTLNSIGEYKMLIQVGSVRVITESDFPAKDGDSSEREIIYQLTAMNFSTGNALIVSGLNAAVGGIWTQDDVKSNRVWLVSNVRTAIKA